MAQAAEQRRRESEPDLNARIAAKLGVGRLRSDAELARLVEERLPVGSIAALAAHGLTDAELYELVVPRRTLTHRRARGELLTREESDRAARLARITAFAEQVFADEAKAGRWLRQPKRRFAGRAPLSMLATESGARLVETALLQIDHGMAA